MGGSFRVGSAALLGVLAVLALVLGVGESWFILVQPDREQVASYHFGSEAMVGSGGWTYSNPEVYGWTSLVGSVVVAGGWVLLSLALLRSSLRLAISGVGIWLVLVLSMAALGRLDWDHRAAPSNWRRSP